MAQKKSSSLKYIYLFGIALLVLIFTTIYLLSQSFGSGLKSKFLSTNTSISDLPNQIDVFSVKRVLVRRDNSCQQLEINRNGDSKLINCENVISNRLLAANDLVNKLFVNLTEEDFINLKGKYYAKGLESDLIITLDTTFGVKIIVISSSDDTAPPVDDTIEDLIDPIEEIEDDLDQPTPTPNPTSNPSATPTPIFSSTPSPTPSSTPTASATPISTAEPFNCDMLNNKNVTVSNERCLEE